MQIFIIVPPNDEINKCIYSWRIFLVECASKGILSPIYVMSFFNTIHSHRLAPERKPMKNNVFSKRLNGKKHSRSLSIILLPFLKYRVTRGSWIPHLYSAARYVGSFTGPSHILCHSLDFPWRLYNYLCNAGVKAHSAEPDCGTIGTL